MTGENISGLQTAWARASGLDSNWSDWSRSREWRGERLQRGTGTKGRSRFHQGDRSYWGFVKEG